MIDIVLVKSNTIIYDPRVIKIVRSLTKRYSVLGLGWNRENLERDKLKHYVIPIRCLNRSAPFGKPTIILHYPLFWLWIFAQLSILKPTVVHACDLDTVIPCYFYKIIFGKKLVFDVFDRYGLGGYVPAKHRRLCQFVNVFEEFFIIHADLGILVAETYLKTLSREPTNVIIIMNCQESNIVDINKPDDNILTLIYTGNIAERLGVGRIVEAVKDLAKVELVLAGYAWDKIFLNKLLQSPNVKYAGFLETMQVLSLEARSDVMIFVYPSITNYRLTIPNKTLEAMTFGMPLITNVAPELVRDIDCGIIVDYNNLDDIRSAIITLRDNPDLCKKFGENGRKAALEKYNWHEMEKRLLQSYGYFFQTNIQ